MNIQDRAVLVKFSAGIGFSFKVTDKKASKEVCKNKSADPSRAEVKKRLVSDDALQPLKNAIQAARDYHEENTLPWSGLGDILRNDKFLEYTQNMRRLTAGIDTARDDFLAEYPSLREAAESALGDLYSPLDFPPVEKIRKGIYHKITVLPIPSGADFRLQLSDEELVALRNQVDAQIRATIFQPFLEPLRNMVRRLTDPEGVFRNTLVTNLEHLLKLVPPGDPEVDRLTKELAEVVKHDADTLRKSPAIRRDTAAKANAILATMADYLPGEVLATVAEDAPAPPPPAEPLFEPSAPEPPPEMEADAVPVGGLEINPDAPAVPIFQPLVLPDPQPEAVCPTGGASSREPCPAPPPVAIQKPEPEPEAAAPTPTWRRRLGRLQTAALL